MGIKDRLLGHYQDNNTRDYVAGAKAAQNGTATDEQLERADKAAEKLPASTLKELDDRVRRGTA